MPYVKGYLDIVSATDPGFGNPGFGGGRPDQGLPGQPAYPSQGPGFPTNPIAPGGSGNYPSNELPGGQGGRPSNELPPIPGIWPPPSPAHPIVPVPPGEEIPPGTIWPPIAPPNSDGKYIVVVFIPGIGYRYTVVDTSLKPSNELPGYGHPDQGLPGSQPGADNTLPGRPVRPDQGLPPTATPKK
jgi:hypothetical protein